ncbi:MAG: IS1595 family transposase [Dehalococcoidia bacterium]|nr:IS1595 family transposase [Dehalococcoidia bacterium]
MTNEPTTLMEAMRYFADPDVALDFMMQLRWPNGVACPRCGNMDVRFLSTRRIWECKEKHAKRQFSIKVGTVFEDSPIPLDKWLAAIWMLANAKNGVSSYELSRSIGVTQKSAWFMLARIRAAMEDGTFNKMEGIVEADETWIGGKARNMHKAQREAKLQGGVGMTGKAAVFGVLERHGPDGHSRVRVRPIPDNKRGTLEAQVRENVTPGANLNTDGAGGYRFLGEEYAHGVVEHDANEYVRGTIHTNGIENFWSLLKRSIHGTYVSVEPFHLFRYLDEQAFRYNSRKITDGERFKAALRGIMGKRLTYADLTSGPAVGTTPA